ncbi:putative signal transduction protein with CBS domains [Rubrobacter xylanophilus DSM 9941]|uniref:Putative signal transduction protein with CBS domains n=1 Tax=Rubrobacter xylanophilus (strain DSM 9941 / JCM 11954 / NBRC 16129 / PRD-1) TaxID=266117 RepID=Q1AXV7_RUBXD|nr:CBS domain-containing protein [Rubrobacter xylanophilus]ABG03771.1 putative signal transduction protein with CBS domains [Rubrobacter xylanophilus DSM 9941]
MEQQDIRRLTVGDVMHADWPTLGPEDTVERAIRLFAESHISGAPVLEDGRLVGIVTEGDLIFRDAEIKAPGFLDILGGIIPLGSWEEYREETLKSAGVTVGEVMTRDVVTVSPQTPLPEAATAMARRRIKLLPVVEGERLLRGVISRMDILALHVIRPRP